MLWGGFMYTLYRFGTYDRAARVIMALEEHQLQYQIETLQLTKAEDHIRLTGLSPYGIVPVLIQDALPPCYDSIAALSLLTYNSPHCQYQSSEETFIPALSLFGFASSTLDAAINRLFGAKIFQGKEAVTDEIYSEVEQYVGILDQRLANNQGAFTVGDQITNADFIILHLAALLNIADELTTFTHLSDYVERHKTRDSVVKAGIFEQDQIDFFLGTHVPMLKGMG